MKRSEELKKEAQSEDNDFKSLALHTKSLREARLEKFEEKYQLQLEQKGYTVIPFDGQKVVIDTETKWGTVDYFPKANRLLIRKKNQWKDMGLNWIVKNLLESQA